MFHPITSFVSLVECVPAHTNTFISVYKSQFCIEVSSNDGYVSFVIFYELLDRLADFLDVMVRIPRVGEVHTHQFDALAVDHVFVVMFSCTHEYVFVMCLPYHARENDYRYRSEIKSKTIGLHQITGVTDLY